MKTILIDTNIYCDAMRGQNWAIELLRSTDKLLMSPIVIGELLAGFKMGSKEIVNRKQLDLFLMKESVELTPITEKTSEYYSIIVSNLKKSGSPIPTNDIWIAANAMENGAMLASFDRHFLKIKGLLIWGIH